MFYMYYILWQLILFVPKYLLASHWCHAPRWQSILPYLFIWGLAMYLDLANEIWVNQMYHMSEQKLYMPTYSLALSLVLLSSPQEQDVQTCTLNMTPRMRRHVEPNRDQSSPAKQQIICSTHVTRERSTSWFQQANEIWGKS